MRPSVFQLLAVLAWTSGAAQGDTGPDSPPSIVRIELSPESNESRPVALPTEPENTLEIEFPWRIEDWAGRGFTPDPERFAGDFVIQATRGKARIFVTPVTAQAHRVLHVILAEPGGKTRSVPIEFIPAPAGLAWRKVVFEDGALPLARETPVKLSVQAPRTLLRDPSPESEIGLIRTLRLMLNTTAQGAAAIAAANSSLALERLDSTPRSFGEYTIANRFAVRDSTTDTLGLCASIANQTDRRLLFEPASWVVRAGDRVYPIRTVDFANELEPGSTAAVFLVLARGPDGSPTLLLPGNTFEATVVLDGSVNPRPVRRMALEGFDPR